MLSASFSRRNCWIKGNAEWRKNSTIQLQEIDLRRIILERIRPYGREERSSFENILILSPDPWTQPGVKNYSTRYHLRPISSTPVILLSNFLHTPSSPYRFLLFRSMARALSTLVVPVDACWRLEDSSANARIRIGPCSERKRGVTHARINWPVAFQDPSSRIVSRWPQGLKEEGVGQRCWNKKRDYIVRLQGCNFSVIRFLSFWFVLVCFTSELIIVIGILEGGEERRGGWMEDRYWKKILRPAGCKTLKRFRRVRVTY